MQNKVGECFAWHHKGVLRNRRSRRCVLPGGMKENIGAGEEGNVFSLAV